MTDEADLTALLRRRIALEGPITVAAFMAEALGHPRFGYYMRQDPLGRSGDFITAPEISQMFGELVGLWCANMWQAMGSPSRVRLVELGPGRGTLMADALRATRRVPGFHAAVEVHLVETSPALRERQRSTLSGEDLPPRHWHGSFADVPDGPMVLVANEFFDALPVHQLQRGDRHWHERLVDFADGKFRLVVSPYPSPLAALLGPRFADAPAGSAAEVCPAALSLAGSIAARLVEGDGAALIVDYGPSRSGPGETLQALRHHAAHEVLADPGAADLTAHVDFEALARAAVEAGAAAHGPVPQGVFLARLGIEARMQVLLRGATEAQRQAVVSGGRRLIEPAQMGTLFKALALTHPDLPVPEGFAA